MMLDFVQLEYNLSERKFGMRLLFRIGLNKTMVYSIQVLGREEKDKINTKKHLFKAK